VPNLFRRISLLLALGLGCVALAWGLFSLQRIFVDERDDALESISARRAALEQYAHKELERRLRDRLAEVTRAMDAAAVDPLMPAEDMWLVDRGEQRLPRLFSELPGDATPAKELYLQLRGPQSEAMMEAEQERDPTSPWAERLELLQELKQALGDGDREAISRSVRSILAHKASYVLVATHEVPFTVAVLSELSEKSTPQPSLMVSLLRDGLSAGSSRIEGLQRELLRHRSRFSRADLEFLRDTIVPLCERAQVLYADFSARVDETGGARLELPDPLDEPTLVADGGWYLEPANEQRVRGVKVQLVPILSEITATMRERALIQPGDGISAAGLSGTMQVSLLALSVDSVRWEPAIAGVDQRYRLKAALEGIIAVLVFGVMMLGAVIYQRRHRFLELKSDFVSAVSHELRTPLASIRLMAETLERRTKDVPRVRDYPARIVRDIDGLSLLVENILSFSRLSRGRWTPKLTELRLSDVVDKLERYQDMWARPPRSGGSAESTPRSGGSAESTPRSGGSSESTLPAELTTGDLDAVVLVADADLLQLLVTNLARNAVQYSEREPVTVHIDAERSGKAWLVRVRDNGVGIAASEREKIFDDFYRSGIAKASGERGSGLGLSICRKIMEAHGGAIRVAASSPEGTTFELRFVDRPRPAGVPPAA
jgi:signal transduction histidine kinase